MPHPLIHVLHRRIGTGWFEKTLSFVVVAVGPQQAGSAPNLDRVRCQMSIGTERVETGLLRPGPNRGLARSIGIRGSGRSDPGAR
jgi:hypothetical protein